METNGEVDKVHISEELSMTLQNVPINNINLTKREKIDVKGKGLMQTFWLEAIDIDALKEVYKVNLRVATKIIFEDDHDSFRPLYQFENKHTQLMSMLSSNSSQNVVVLATSAEDDDDNNDNNDDRIKQHGVDVWEKTNLKSNLYEKMIDMV
jgi:hypothetical protein